ncbi:hypothetical protein [Adhaeribacter radiodurans]|uniref:Uncharacterized protein n=1 Tax=Adhaeribacter radiodurans TaxID=2745197 RepID=A0A7L7L2E0_9BACT|nr:hypothetical protein [Adhaeribacter radiodurans]QMU26930.1 hypothetical protein HUW48_02275 [Adhaeribacter radiodurans]
MISLRGFATDVPKLKKHEKEPKNVVLRAFAVKPCSFPDEIVRTTVRL